MVVVVVSVGVCELRMGGGATIVDTTTTTSTAAQ